MANLISLLPDYFSMDLSALLETLYAEKGIDFRGYKKSSLKRRLRRRLEIAKASSIKEYLRLVEASPQEYEELVETLLVKETSFFRDPEVFEELRKTVLPDVLSGKKKGEIRIWCPGCATGEEAYSVAMLLAEELASLLHQHELKLYATDLSPRALKAARLGKYSDDKLEALPAELAEKYFPGGRVTEGLRRTVIFGRHNLVSDPPIANLDLLLCRYVLIYFNSKLQREVFGKLHYALREGGFLVLGKSEALPRGMETLFEAVSPGLRIYSKL